MVLSGREPRGGARGDRRYVEAKLEAVNVSGEPKQVTLGKVAVSASGCNCCQNARSLKSQENVGQAKVQVPLTVLRGPEKFSHGLQFGFHNVDRHPFTKGGLPANRYYRGVVASTESCDACVDQTRKYVCLSQRFVWQILNS